MTFIFFFSSRRRHTRSLRDWSSDVCSSDLQAHEPHRTPARAQHREQRDDDEPERAPPVVSRFAHIGQTEHPAGREQQARSEEHTSELQSRRDLVCRLLLEKKKKKNNNNINN